ncbi:MAG TPA: hypothetical protein GX497_13485 [Bacillus bacterium]|nr:hypothetical protein [Bacillus sp. (in: firmicutes)]
MQIYNQFSTNQLSTTERPLELKQGESYNAQIKERVSDTEAIIQIRGKEIKATFEGQVPKEDRVTVQVNGQKDQSVLVKTIATDAQKPTTAQAQAPQPQALANDAKALQSVGITAKDIPELKQSVQILLDKGTPVTKEIVQELRNFFEKAEGSPAAKMDTVKALVNKGLEVTQSHLRPIHEALHGKPLNEVLTGLAKEIDPEFDIVKNEQKEVETRPAQRNLANEQTTSKQEVADSMPRTSRTDGKSVTSTTTETIKAEKQSTETAPATKQLTELLQKNREFVEKASDLKEAVEKVRAEIVKNPSIDRELAQKVEKAASEAEKLQAIGKDRLIQALKNAEEQLVKKEQQSQENTKVTANQNRGVDGASLREATPREIVQIIKEEVSKTPNLQRALEMVKSQIIDNPKIPAEVIEKVKQAVEEAGRLQQQGRITVGKETLVNALNTVESELATIETKGKDQQQQQASRITDQPASETVKQIKEEVQREANLERAIEKVRVQVVNNPKVDRAVAEEIEKAVNVVRQLHRIGQDSMGRDYLARALDQAEQDLKQVEARQQQQPKVEQSQQSKAEQGQQQLKVEQQTQSQPERRPVEQQPGKVEQQNQQQQASRITDQPASETVKQIKEEVQREANLDRAIEKVREQVVNNPKVNQEVAEKIDKALTEARQLQQVGRETMGRERLTQALKQAEQELKQIEVRQQQASQPKAEQNQQQQDTQVKDLKLNQQPQSQQQQGRQTTGQPASETAKQVKEEIQREVNLQKVIDKVREQVVNNPKVNQEVAEKIDKALTEARQLQQVGRETMGRERLTQALEQAEQELKQIEVRQQQASQPKAEQNQQQQDTQVKDLKLNQQPQSQQQQGRQATEQPASETVKQVKEEIQREANLQKVIDKVRDQVVNNPKVNQEIAEKIDKALTEARQLQQVGREPMGRERLTQALEQAEQELKQVEARQQQITKNEQGQATQQQPKAEQGQQLQQPQVEQQPQPQPDRRPTEQQSKAEQPNQTQQAVRTTDQSASETVKQVKEEIQREADLQKVIDKVRDQVVNNPKVNQEVAEKIDKALTEARQLQQDGREPMGRERLTQALEQAEQELKQVEARQQQITKNEQGQATQQQPKAEQGQQLQQPKVEQQMQPQQDRRPTEQQSKAEQLNQTQQAVRTTDQSASETVKQVKEEIQREADLQKVIDKVREQVVNNPKVNREVAERVEKAVTEARQLQQIGREGMSRDHLIRAIDQAERDLRQIEAQQQIPKAEHGQQVQQSKVEQGQQMQLPASEATNQPASEVIKQIKEAVQREANIQRAVEVVRNLIANNKNIDMEAIRPIEQIANQASQLDQAGRERIAKILEQVEDVIKQTEVRAPNLAQNQSQTQNQMENKGVSEQNQIETEAQNSKQVESLSKTQSDQQSQTKATQSAQTNNDQLSKILADMIEQESPTATNKTGPSELIKEALKQIQKEPSLERALNQIRQEILSNPNLDLKMVEKVENAIDRSSQLLEKGRELGARQQITNALTEVEQELARTESEPLQAADQQRANQDALIKQFEQNVQFQTLPLESKNLLVTKVTQKLAQATHDFRELKREITRNLDTIERLANMYKKNAYPQAKQILETTINKLDNAILKSDMMLFTDMKTEKQLMQASSQLADAKKLLAKGNHAEAAKIVHDIKALMDKINFKPSDQKVMHYVSKESMNVEPKSAQRQMLNQFDETARSYVRQEPSARQMYETVRSLGLNHDSDLAKSLVFQKGGNSQFNHGHGAQEQQQNHEQQQNLKAVLMKLAQTGGDEASTKIAQQAEQALNNLTGQQLLSKSDSGNTLQSMFFNLPLLLGEKPQNLQVFVNSKKEGQQVDWENCNLYFLIETKKLGDVGIMLSSTERSLSITIKNDKTGFKQKMEPIAAFTKEKLQEIGYNVGNINFTRMTPINSQQASGQQEKTNKEEQQMQMRPVFTEKGMDFKI